jgi:hypothetical protein
MAFMTDGLHESDKVNASVGSVSDTLLLVERREEDGTDALVGVEVGRETGSVTREVAEILPESAERC